jgi:hypothetical protein
VVALVSAYVAFAAISLSTSAAYTQNFDTLGIPLSSPTPSNLPVDFRQETISAVRTLGSFFSGNPQTLRVGGANLSTTAANGSYNFGAGATALGNSDRAPGFLASGTATMSGNLYAHLVNNTGDALSGLLVSYDVEKYRNGSNPAGFRYQLFYSTDGISWTNAGPDFLTSFTPDAARSCRLLGQCSCRRRPLPSSRSTSPNLFHVLRRLRLRPKLPSLVRPLVLGV